jgi:hypothetical protein
MVGHLLAAHTALASLGAWATVTKGHDPLPAKRFQDQSFLLGTVVRAADGGRSSCLGRKPPSSPVGEKSPSREGLLIHQSAQRPPRCAMRLPTGMVSVCSTVRLGQDRLSGGLEPGAVRMN